MTEIESAALYFEYFGNQASTVEGKSILLGKGHFDWTENEPFGVSAQIIPWNHSVEMTASDVAAGLAGHPDERQVIFTGSVRTGIAIATAAAQNLVRCVLELRGKSAAIVHDAADLDAFEKTFTGAFTLTPDRSARP
jgi:aldehyde dehydrogenase (NAD+)